MTTFDTIDWEMEEVEKEGMTRLGVLEDGDVRKGSWGMEE